MYTHFDRRRMTLTKMAVEHFLRFLTETPFGIGTVFVVCCAIAVPVWILLRPKPGKNPFSLDHVRRPPTLEIDHAARNKILKQRFKTQKIPDNLDTIIIGSGIGGLSTAVLLSRAGQKVLVLEQHDQAGGCCHTFVDKGFEFDIGIHYVGKMMDGDRTRVLTDQITEGQVLWVPMEDVFDKVAIGPSDNAKVYTMMSGTYEKFADDLERQFPDEKEAIAKYVQLLKDCRRAFFGMILPKILPKWLMQILINTGIYSLVMRNYTRLYKMSVKHALDQISDNQEFKGVLSYVFGDMGPLPSDLGILGHAVLINHYMPGSFYPLGGPSEIALQIIPIIERYGGRVLVDAPVTNILVNGEGRANGVTVHKTGGDINIYAKRVVSDAGVINTLKYLLPSEIAVKAPLYHYIDNVGPSLSNVSVFVGLNGSQKDLQLQSTNTWAFTGYDLEKEVENYLSLSLEEAVDSPCPLLFISFPSAKDPAYNDKYPGKSVALVITLAPWSWFAQWKDTKLKHRGDDYEALKMRLAHQMWRQCEQLFPQLEGKMEYLDVGTPLSNKHYLGQPEGEMYGLAHNKARFQPEVAVQLRPESGIPGLFLTGQDILTCGFNGAIHAGAMTAGAILNRNLLNDLLPVVKETKETNKLVKEKVQ